MISEKIVLNTFCSSLIRVNKWTKGSSSMTLEFKNKLNNSLVLKTN
jgi:hypothetical protein